MSSYAELVRRMIDQKKNREREFYKECSRRSAEYMKALELVSDDDLNVLHRIAQEKEFDFDDIEDEDFDEQAGRFVSISARVASETPDFLDFEIEGQTFRLFIENAVEPPSGGINPMVIAFCASTNDLNNPASENYNCFNIVPEEWHKKIVDHLKNTKLDLVSDKESAPDENKN